MGEFVCKCKCGAYYTHEELESAVCPYCKRVGTNLKTAKHNCFLCQKFNECTLEKQKLIQKAGVCFNFVKEQK